MPDWLSYFGIERQELKRSLFSRTKLPDAQAWQPTPRFTPKTWTACCDAGTLGFPLALLAHLRLKAGGALFHCPGFSPRTGTTLCAISVLSLGLWATPTATYRRYFPWQASERERRRSNFQASASALVGLPACSLGIIWLAREIDRRGFTTSKDSQRDFARLLFTGRNLGISGGSLALMLAAGNAAHWAVWQFADPGAPEPTWKSDRLCAS